MIQKLKLEESLSIGDHSPLEHKSTQLVASYLTIPTSRQLHTGRGGTTRMPPSLK